MNELLQLKGTFTPKKNTSRPGAPELPRNVEVNSDHLENLKKQLEQLILYWQKENILSGALISVFYRSVIAKSRRISALLALGKQSSNSSIVGAKFSGKEDSLKHVITHYVSLEVIKETIRLLQESIEIICTKFQGKISTSTLEQINRSSYVFKYKLSKRLFSQVIVDAYFVEKFGVSPYSDKTQENTIITIYKTDVKTTDLLEKIGLSINPGRILDETTLLLLPDELQLLKQKVPYLIAMGVTDLSTLPPIRITSSGPQKMTIPPPVNEPIIGVIDTMFDESVYFSQWVQFKKMIPDAIPIEPSDYIHGPAVSSIIVDGASFNPRLDDGCGRFRVRHFGVSSGKSFSSFLILKAIKEIVTANRDIKVWNLSLGSAFEINPNFISPEAAFLDKIQYENDVIFVIAGTNQTEKKQKYLGAPADSINSLVVNSVNFSGKPASYSREGPVLSFFVKPDISYYGGDGTKKEDQIRVCRPTGEAFVAGTSFAAPWISRKLAYLINVLGFSREVAKALIIHSSTTWEKQTISSFQIGYGVVPINIKDIIYSPNDEIRFIILGISEQYDAYNYNLPVPSENNTFPFIAKATMCYFPYSSRNQGVDYTNTELDLTFGRINHPGKKPAIIAIDNNYQDSDSGCFIYEEEARKFFRKWDNVKHIREILNPSRKKRSKKSYTGLWGISVKSKERLEEKFGRGLKFGIVVSLKEVNGVNRIDEFVQACSLRGWLVNRINIDNQVKIFNKLEEQLDFFDQK